MGTAIPMPQIQFGRFHFHSICGLGCHQKFNNHLVSARLRQPADYAVRIAGISCRFRFRTSLSLSRSHLFRPDSVPSSHIGPPSMRNTPPSSLFLVQPGHLPVSALRSVSRACASSRGRNPPTPTGAWCQMVALPPTPDAASELPAQAGLVAAAAAAAVSPVPAVEGTHPPPHQPSGSMARLRLGYTKSRTGCLRCKQRRVKVNSSRPSSSVICLTSRADSAMKIALARPVCGTMSTAVLSRDPRGAARARRRLHSRLLTLHVPGQPLYVVPSPRQACLLLVTNPAVASPIRALTGGAAPGTTDLGPRTRHGRRATSPICGVLPLLSLCLIAPVPHVHDDREQPPSC
jgi:hypothetical protein